VNASVVVGTILVSITVVVGTILVSIIVVAGAMLVGITVVVGILVLIASVVSGGVARVNTSFIKYCEFLFRNHGLERNATDEYD